MADVTPPGVATPAAVVRKVFRYSALTAAGDLVTGDLAGPDAAFVLARLHDQALLPIDASERTASASRAAFSLGRAGPLLGRELALTSQQLARLLKAGLPLDRALAILVDLVEGKRMAAVLRATLERVRDGAALAEAMAAQGRALSDRNTAVSNQRSALGSKPRRRQRVAATGNRSRLSLRNEAVAGLRSGAAIKDHRQPDRPR